MKKIIVTLIGLLSVIGMSSQQPSYYHNPVIHGDLADPCMIRIGDIYYATGTSSEWAPFYPVFKSKDLINWEQTGHIFGEKPEWTSSSFWAPELFFHNNQVYCYYTARRKTDGVSYIGVATAKTPTEEFTDHGLLVEFGTEAIDAFIFDDDGQLYITWKAYGLDKRPIELIGSKLSADGMKLEGEPFSLMIDDERIGMEGQYHFKKGDYYYILYSARSCCGPQSDYDVRVSRSKNFRGPYEKYAGNPILYGAGHDYISCGHGTATTTADGRMFYMCHAYLKGDGFYAGRQPILQEMYVGDDNWVHFTSGNIAKAKQPMPFKGTVQQPLKDFEDSFDAKNIKLDWAWNYVYSDNKAKVQDGKLLLSGVSKGDTKNATAMCLRPKSDRYSYETTVLNMNESLKGLTIYGDNKNYLAFGLQGDYLILYMVKDGRKSTLAQMAQLNTPAHLKVNIEKGCIADFFWSTDAQVWKKVNDNSVNCNGLVRWDRVARPGLIFDGDVNAPAEFSYFKLTNTNK